MAFRHQALLSTLLLLLLLSTNFLLIHADTSTGSGGGFSLELLHRDSPRSPYHNASATPYDRLLAATRRSLSRVQYLSNKLHSHQSFQSSVIHHDLNYYASLSLGTPPTSLDLLIDTGSYLTWVQCEPCTDCFNQTASSFNPDKSSTYQTISCHSPACNRNRPKTTCTDGLCSYRTSYADRSSSQGILSSDTLSIGGTSNVSIRMPNTIFGCSHKIEGGHYYSTIQGLLGLGRGPSSIVSQLGTTIGSKFAYCLASEQSSSSVLSFGDASVVRSTGFATTPLHGPNHYYITLEEIVVGDDVEGGGHTIRVRTRHSSKRKVMVDSGSTLTFLPDRIVEQLERKLSDMIKFPPVTAVQYYRMCFQASKSEMLDLPDITFRFAGPAPMRLRPNNTFIVVAEEGVVCLSILPSSFAHGLSVIGSLAQQNFHIGYDLEAKKLSFAPADCTKISTDATLEFEPDNDDGVSGWIEDRATIALSLFWKFLGLVVFYGFIFYA